MSNCRKCGCLCDPGDLVNGVCDDCREADRRAESKNIEMYKMMHGEFEQMRMEDMTYAN